MNVITTIGLHLTMNGFQVPGVDDEGAAGLLFRNIMAPFWWS